MVISIVRKIVPARAFLLFLVVSLGLLAYVTMDLRRLDSWHSDELSSWRTLRINAIIDKHVAGKLQQDEKVVFNCAGNNPVMFMFYTGRTAYRRYPVKKEYLALKSRGIRMATFADENLPGFLRGDPSVRKINLKQLYY
jgi:hypothetical protein